MIKVSLNFITMIESIHNVKPEYYELSNQKRVY